MLPSILLLNVNGSGMGHLNRCLAYALRMRGRARPYFFSLASAIEIIEEMGFEADYFVSHYWSSSTTFAWNSELALRFGLMLERVRPAVVVFDGTWPFQGFMAACKAYGTPVIVWSNRGLFKADTGLAQVDMDAFDLIIQPGELGTEANVTTLAGGGRRLVVPPVCLLNEDELMERTAAREALGLASDARYVLFSLGPGNLKDITSIGNELIHLFEKQGFRVVWARAPISVRDVELPSSVQTISVYPLVRYLRAFDAFVGAAGYNSCCEVVQSGIPSLLVPNEQLVDDQVRRAQLVASLIPAVVSACETDSQRNEAIKELLGIIAAGKRSGPSSMPMNGAALAAEEIITLTADKGDIERE